MLNRIPVSVIIPVKNEEKNIQACLESVEWASEIFVVDSHSIDRTVDIAQKYTDKIYQFDYHGGWPKKKNWALDNLPFSNGWILIIDADERITPSLKEEIEAAILSKQYEGYYVNRRVIFLGKWIKHGGWYPNWNLRLFKHRLGRYEYLGTEDTVEMGDNEVHEHVALKGKAGFLKHDMVHEDFRNLSHFIERQNRHSNWEVRAYSALKSASGKNTIGSAFFGGPLERKRFLKKLWVRLPFRPFLRFILMYFIRLGFLDGKPGYIFCRLFSQYEFWISIKRYESRFKSRGTQN